MAKLPNKVRKLDYGFLSIFSFWLFLVLISPLMLPENSIKDLSGTVNAIDNMESIANMNPIPAFVYWIGDINCHQMATRSYFLNGNQMPFCARDVGIFAGLVIGMILAIIFNLNPAFRILMVGVIPMMIDGTLQLLSPYESSNQMRLITGIIAGSSLAIILHKVAIIIQNNVKPT
ncbi:MAG: DUF2085 domain-containing protein [Methanomassiliicoccales archaeon]